MKILKQSLCIVLTFILLMGIFCINSCATLVDEDQTQYKVAVNVMNGMGIISGYEDGTFRPTTSVNRAEAAKMICYALIGKEAADGLQADISVFPDVPANSWYAPYVMYLNTLKVIAGFDDGNFYPGEKVTGLQLAKMLLVAAGYGQEGEYEGEGYSTKTFVDALNLGSKSIFYGTKATDMTVPVTREEAALYIYNGMCYLTQVSYKPSSSLIGLASEYVGKGSTMASARYHYVPEAMTVSSGSGVVILSPTAAEGYIVANTSTNSALRKNIKETNKNSDGYYNWTMIVDSLTVAAPVYTKYKVDTNMDLYGHRVKIYYNDSTKEVYYVEDLAKTAVSTVVNSKFLQKDTMNKLGFSYSTDAKNTDTIILIDDYAFAKDTLTAININGNSVILIDNNQNGKVDTVVYLTNSQVLNKITAYAAPTSTTSGSISFKFAVNGKITYQLPKTTVTDEPEILLYDQPAKNDYVYVTNITGAPKVEKADYVIGTLTQYSSSSITVSGKSYKLGTLTTQNAAAGLAGLDLVKVSGAAVSATTMYKFVFFADGTVAGCTNYNENTQYAVVLQTGVQGANTNGDLSNSDAVASIRLALPDGSVNVYKLKLTGTQKAMDKATLEADVFTGIIPGTIIKYAASGNIISSFEIPTTYTGKVVKNNAVIQSGTSTGAYFTNTTAFIYWKTTDTEYKVTAVQGYTNASNADVTYILNTAGDKVILAYANVEKTNNAKYGYLKSAGYGTILDGEKTMYTYTIYIDGIAKSFKSEAIYTGLTTGTFVNYELDDAGYLTNLENTPASKIVTGKVNYVDDHSIVIDGTNYQFKDTIIATIETNGTIVAHGSLIENTQVKCLIGSTENSIPTLAQIYIITTE